MGSGSSEISVGASVGVGNGSGVSVGGEGGTDVGAGSSSVALSAAGEGTPAVSVAATARATATSVATRSAMAVGWSAGPLVVACCMPHPINNVAQSIGASLRSIGRGIIIKPSLVGCAIVSIYFRIDAQPFTITGNEVSYGAATLCAMQAAYAASACENRIWAAASSFRC